MLVFFQIWNLFIGPSSTFYCAVFQFFAFLITSYLFSANDITLDILKDIDDASLAALIPKIGPRFILKRKLENLNEDYLEVIMNQLVEYG